MPVPYFDQQKGALPPFLGPIERGGPTSPYVCSLVEVATTLATTEERKRLLLGLIDLRRELRSSGIEAVQWLDGSFVEDIERLKGVPPKDIDVVTYTSGTVRLTLGSPLLSPKASKARFQIDHFLVSGDMPLSDFVEAVGYWYGIFSHRRDRTWKGILQVSLTADDCEDDAARLLLGGGQ
jgi:hypothetical protein